MLLYIYEKDKYACELQPALCALPYLGNQVGDRKLRHYTEAYIERVFSFLFQKSNKIITGYRDTHRGIYGKPLGKPSGLLLDSRKRVERSRRKDITRSNRAIFYFLFCLIEFSRSAPLNLTLTESER